MLGYFCILRCCIKITRLKRQTKISHRFTKLGLNIHNFRTICGLKLSNLISSTFFDTPKIPVRLPLKVWSHVKSCTLRLRFLFGALTVEKSSIVLVRWEKADAPPVMCHCMSDQWVPCCLNVAGFQQQLLESCAGVGRAFASVSLVQWLFCCWCLIYVTYILLNPAIKPPFLYSLQSIVNLSPGLKRISYSFCFSCDKV